MGIYTTCVVFIVIINSFCSISVLKALKQPSPGEGEIQFGKEKGFQYSPDIPDDYNCWLCTFDHCVLLSWEIGQEHTMYLAALDLCFNDLAWWFLCSLLSPQSWETHKKLFICKLFSA